MSDDEEKDSLHFPLLLLEEGRTATNDSLSSTTAAVVAPPPPPPPATTTPTTTTTTKNKKMTLSDAVAELECRGFSCADIAVSDDRVGEGGDGSVVVGTLSIRAWWNPSCLKRHVFVHRVVGAGALTVERIERDLCRVGLFAEEHQGCWHGLLVLVYLVEEEEGEEESPWRRSPSRSALDPDVVSFVGAKPETEAWGRLMILAVRDGAGNSYYYEGDCIEPELKYWAGLLTGRRPGTAAASPPPSPSSPSSPPYHHQKRKFAFLLSGCVVVLPIWCHEAWTDLPWLLLYLRLLLSLLVPLFAVLAWSARRRRRRKRAEILERTGGRRVV